jgi:hypothetical protein
MEIFPRTIVSSDLEVYAREMQQITSFGFAASLQKTIKSTQQSRAEKKYLLAMQSLRSQGKNYTYCNIYYINRSLSQLVSFIVKKWVFSLKIRFNTKRLRDCAFTVHSPY